MHYILSRRLQEKDDEWDLIINMPLNGTAINLVDGNNGTVNPDATFVNLNGEIVARSTTVGYANINIYSVNGKSFYPSIYQNKFKLSLDIRFIGFTTNYPNIITGSASGKSDSGIHTQRNGANFFMGVAANAGYYTNIPLSNISLDTWLNLYMYHYDGKIDIVLKEKSTGIIIHEFHVTNMTPINVSVNDVFSLLGGGSQGRGMNGYGKNFKFWIHK